MNHVMRTLYYTIHDRSAQSSVISAYNASIPQNVVSRSMENGNHQAPNHAVDCIQSTGRRRVNCRSVLVLMLLITIR
jgi:hypothetical protein